MEVNRKELQSALQKCLPGVETGKQVLEGADTFIFAEGHIFSYNDSISVSVPFKMELEGAVKAKEFYTLISKLSGDEIKIAAVGDNAWKLKAGSATAEMTLLEPSVMSHIKGLTEHPKWKALPSNFMDGLSLCKFSCNRSALSGIYVNEAIMAATDELRINWFALDSEMDSFWISDPAVGELMGLKGLKDYALAEAWAHFKTEDGTTFSCKRLQHDKYPFEKIQSLVNKHKKGKDDITNDLPAKLAEVVDRASTLSLDIDSHPSVRLTFRKEFIEVYSQRSTGKYQEKVAWDKEMKADFDPIVLYVDFSMIVYGLKRSKSFYIKQTEGKGGIQKRIIFQGDKISHILSTFQVGQE